MILALDEAGITNLTDFMSLRHEDIPSLVYQPQLSKKPRSLRLNDVGMIQILITYERQLMQDNVGILSLEQWDVITCADFDEFRIRGPAPQPTMAIATQPRPAPKQADPVSDFKKGIKRNAAVYPIIKDQNQWVNWNRTVISQARAHDVQEVFDITYRPTTHEETQLFE